MIPRRIVLVLLVLLATGVLYADHDRDIGLLYSKEAEGLYRSGKFEPALSCINAALEFYPGNSDALFLKGLIAYDSGAGPSTAAGILDRALSAGGWSSFSPGEAKKSAFFLRMEAEEYDKALELIDSRFLQLAGDEKLYYARAVALEETGSPEEALETARYAVEVFDDVDRFARIIVRLDREYRDTVVRNISAGRGADVPLTVIAEAIRNLENNADKKLLVEYYLERGGIDPDILIENIRFKRATTRDELEELVLSGLFDNAGYLTRLTGYLQRREELDALRDLFSGYTGTMKLAESGGYTERGRYRDGVPWEIDARWTNTNRTVKIVLSGGRPTSVIVSGPGNRYEYTYGIYPDLTSVDVLEESNKRVYIMKRGKRMDILESVLPGYPVFRIDHDSLLSTEDELTEGSERIITLAGDDYLVDTSFTDTGGRIIRESMRDVMDRTIITGNGFPKTGVVDTDQDGRYETVLEYEDGDLSEIRYDGNDNGIYEYMYRPGSDALEEWDFDEDGNVDVREYIKDGTRYLDYDADGDGEYITYRREGTIWRLVK